MGSTVRPGAGPDSQLLELREIMQNLSADARKGQSCSWPYITTITIALQTTPPTDFTPFKIPSVSIAT